MTRGRVLLMTRRRVLVAALVLLCAAAAAVAILNFRDEENVDAAVPAVFSQAQVQRGEYLARAGNCATCHTARGGEPYAGGRVIDTPFGAVFASNLTPDARTGIGNWSAGHFWRALHNGRSADGRLLYPAFPYPNFTQVTRADSDALFAYLRSLAPVEQANRPHQLRFPYNSQVALAVWRALFFTPGAFEPDASRSAEWNRGAYLVRGLGHCNACHGGRNAFGATVENLELSGGLIPMQNWYAPSLTSPDEAGVAHWDTRQVVGLLKDGVTTGASVLGPMASVVYGSTQYLSEGDLAAMAAFLKSLPQSAPRSDEPDSARDAAVDARGARIYEDRCADCHGPRGEGSPNAFPPLAGNRAVTLEQAANLIRIVLDGGYLPSTQGNPRPYGMPPFATVLSNDEVAQLLSYVRGSWGNRAAPVSPLDAAQSRSVR